jgi:hypothetical protein
MHWYSEDGRYDDGQTVPALHCRGAEDQPSVTKVRSGEEVTHQENINFAYQCLGMLGVCLMRLNDCSKHF